jgi:hypothetical protein
VGYRTTAITMAIIMTARSAVSHREADTPVHVFSGDFPRLRQCTIRSASRAVQDLNTRGVTRSHRW